MQSAHVKFLEAVWEITDNCKNNCSYCGTKDFLNKVPINVNQLKDIIDKIVDYPPEELNISGGDPLLVPIEVHKYLAEKLKGKTKLKIIFNPKSLAFTNVNEILPLYDWMGISVNTIDELEYLMNKMKEKPKRSTIITNFSLSTVWNYNRIEEFVTEFDIPWQIQYTMFKDRDTIFSVYNNEEGLEYLFEHIDRSFEKGLNLSISDNMNRGKCTAASNSMGILSNGDVIPCLSMRCWNMDKVTIFGNLINDDLKTIWEGDKISKWRCNEFECCKDICDAPYDRKKKRLKEEPFIKTPEETVSIPSLTPYKPFIYPESAPIVMMYGVQTVPRDLSTPLDKWFIRTTSSTSGLFDKPLDDNKDLK